MCLHICVVFTAWLSSAPDDSVPERHYVTQIEPMSGPWGGLAPGKKILTVACLALTLQFLLSGTESMAAATCGPHSAAGNTKKPHNNKEHSRRNRENSRRRQAALLFLSNISLDGRPVQSNSAENGGSRHHRETDSPAGPTAPEPSSSYGPMSIPTCGKVNPSTASRSGLLGVPPILVLPSDTGFDDAGCAEVLLGHRRGSFPSPGNTHLLSASPSSSSLLPSPLGPRKSSTLLSVHSCNSVSSEPRQRWDTHRGALVVLPAKAPRNQPNYDPGSPECSLGHKLNFTGRCCMILLNGI